MWQNFGFGVMTIGLAAVFVVIPKIGSIFALIDAYRRASPRGTLRLQAALTFIILSGLTTFTYGALELLSPVPLVLFLLQMWLLRRRSRTQTGNVPSFRAASAAHVR